MRASMSLLRDMRSIKKIEEEKKDAILFLLVEHMIMIAARGHQNIIFYSLLLLYLF